MKILLHALIGYFALPFHPFFGFASPLPAINHDGYYVTSSIQVVETCETISTQNHASDTSSALMKCVPRDSDTGDILEARQDPGFGAGDILPIASIVLATIGTVALALVWIAYDNPKRQAFTRNTVDEMIAKWPKFNWVICHPGYSIDFDGADGKDYGYTHYELPISFGRTIGYDLYWARSGTFQRYGDGGFINWAYNGNILGTDDDGAIVHFGVIS